MQIHKYTLQQDEWTRQIFWFPKSSKVLSVGVQGEFLTIWVLLGTSGQSEQYWIQVRGTGQECPESIDDFIGTVVSDERNYSMVWHVFGGWV